MVLKIGCFFSCEYSLLTQDLFFYLGWYVKNIKDKLSLILRCFSKTNTVPDTIKVKFSADGFKISNKTNSLGLACCISFIEPSIKEHSSNKLPNHFILGIYYLNTNINLSIYSFRQFRLNVYYKY